MCHIGQKQLTTAVLNRNFVKKEKNKTIKLLFAMGFSGIVLSYALLCYGLNTVFLGRTNLKMRSCFNPKVRSYCILIYAGCRNFFNPQAHVHLLQLLGTR